MSKKFLFLAFFVTIFISGHSQQINNLKYSLSSQHPDAVSDSGAYSWVDSAYVFLHVEATQVDTSHHLLIKDKTASGTTWLNSHYFQYGDPVPGTPLSYRQNGSRLSLGIGPRSINSAITTNVYLLAADSSYIDSLSITIPTP